MTLKPDLSFDKRMQPNKKAQLEMRKALLDLGFTTRESDRIIKALITLKKGEVLHFRNRKLLVEKK